MRSILLAIVGLLLGVLVVGIYSWWTQPLVRPLREGDTFLYAERRGRVRVRVLRDNPLMLGVQPEGTARIPEMRLRLKWGPAFLELLEVEMRREPGNCELRRGEKGRGFLLFPWRRVLRFPGQYGLHFICRDGRALAVVQWGEAGEEMLSVGRTRVRARIYEVRVRSFAEGEEGRLRLWLAPEIGFLARIRGETPERAFALELVTWEKG